MAKQLAAAFLRCALGPVRYAGECILARRVPEALEELSKESLLGAIDRGVMDVASRAAVKRREIETALPMPDIWQEAEKLGRAHEAAHRAWGVLAGQGGLITGAGDLTVDGRPKDTAECLRRLAKKLEQDEGLAGPLLALADEVDSWVAVVESCRARLEQEGALERAFVRRRARRAILAAVIVVFGFGGAGTFGWIYSVRSRIQGSLDVPDGCAVAAVAEADLRFASDAQRAEIAERSRRCEEARALEEARAREEAERQAREQREREAREARVTACKALVDHVRAGALEAGDDETAGPAAALLGRVAARRLEPADLGPNGPELPCADADAVPALEAAFADAVVSEPTLWVRTEVASERLSRALAAKKAELKDLDVRLFVEQAETRAQTALTSGKSERIAAAAAVCKLLSAVEQRAPRSCSAAIELAARP